MTNFPQISLHHNIKILKTEAVPECCVFIHVDSLTSNRVQPTLHLKCNPDCCTPLNTRKLKPLCYHAKLTVYNPLYIPCNNLIACSAGKLRKLVCSE